MIRLTRAEIEMLARLWRRGRDTMEMTNVTKIREPVIYRHLREIREFAKDLEATRFA
jgi:hypothetical protein